jgi:hypothetical protein
MMTAREMANRVRECRQSAWDGTDSTAMLTRDRLDADDLRTVRRVVAEAGYEGEEVEPKVRRVSSLVLGQVAALSDNMPADGAD